MGGEMAGMVVIGFEYDSVDAAMAGQAGFYHDDQLVGMMQDTQVQINRRILFVCNLSAANVLVNTARSSTWRAVL